MGRGGRVLIAGTQVSLPWSSSRKEILHTMTPPCRKVQVKYGPRAVGKIASYLLSVHDQNHLISDYAATILKREAIRYK